MISYPESSELQDEIVKTMEAIDTKISVDERINDNLQAQAQTLWDKFFSYGPHDELPDGWSSVTLDKVTKNIRTRVGDRNCQVLSALNTGVLCPSEKYFSKQVYSKDIRNYILVEMGDFAYNPARVNIGSIGINDLDNVGCVSPVYVVFRVEPSYQNFFRFFLETKRFKEEVKARSSGSVRQSMSYKDFGLIEIAYPPLDLVTEFNEAYLPLLKGIQQYETQNNKLCALRDTLLPRLMSGEIDVSAIDI